MLKLSFLKRILKSIDQLVQNLFEIKLKNADVVDFIMVLKGWVSHWNELQDVNKTKQ
jgi:hypothetical protein